ncbi:MAG: sugar transferase [Chloroflexota bacterium]|nr:MAG: sugar transferase [Chloroflexota bacterium]
MAAADETVCKLKKSRLRRANLGREVMSQDQDAHVRTGPYPVQPAAATRAVDIALASIGLTLVAPLLVFLAVLVQWDSPGPAFYPARRVGRNGRPFTMFKLRTMAHGVTGPAVTRNRDPRVTPVGAILRQAKLDELPQLLNVVRGEMALVGPRPEAPVFVEARRDDFAPLLSIRPGLFGISQIVFRDEQALLPLIQAGVAATGKDAPDLYADWILPRKIELDRRYLARRSFALDLGILARSLVGLLRRW